ncbi:ubiquitin-like-specific protease 1D [Striga asiatica]|uniref:Ubiquitin-like-specific protease 1D n=1 Tax=Striga asiatica TaxID=4170 RepID=A0A5A7RBG2_STRAF|nr:ubiquitin-like-specific protease 1D [Striga asiatica]
MGERKRKVGPLVLDWEILLPHCESEPPPIVVIEAEESNPQAAEVMDQEEQYGDPSLHSLPDKELRDRIDRFRNMLSGGGVLCKLADGGEKLRVSLKKAEAELERRNRRKVNDKCKNVAPLADHSISIGTTDDVASRGGPPVSRSEFASHFCGKLDAKSPAKSFSGELSTLNPCNPKRENESLFAQKTGLSSREKPFKSPNHLSVLTNGSSQSIRKQSGGFSSCSPPFRSKKDYSNYHEKRENATRFQPIRTSKRNNRGTVVLVDEEELEVETVNEGDPLGQSSQDSTIYYPSRDDPEAVQIYYSDLECLAPQTYVSSTIMNFYIR